MTGHFLNDDVLGPKRFETWCEAISSSDPGSRPSGTRAAVWLEWSILRFYHEYYQEEYKNRKSRVSEKSRCLTVLYVFLGRFLFPVWLIMNFIGVFLPLAFVVINWSRLLEGPVTIQAILSVFQLTL